MGRFADYWTCHPLCPKGTLSYGYSASKLFAISLCILFIILKFNYNHNSHSILMMVSSSSEEFKMLYNVMFIRDEYESALFKFKIKLLGPNMGLCLKQLVLILEKIFHETSSFIGIYRVLMKANASVQFIARRMSFNVIN